ncbi:MAG: YmdB family metallophosphoesterase [Phycisphaerae bacterium]|nr:YmdB family metallophosphoesterase [Phycisphaerae bacterium]
MYIHILCVGDVVGKAGRSVLAEHLPQLIQEHTIDFVVCNAENAAGGSGMTPQIYEKLLRYGVDVVTLGDHCFRKADVFPLLDSSDRLIRPANLPSAAAGRGWTVIPGKSGRRQIGVICALGQMEMGNNNSPWAAVDEAMAKMPPEVSIRILDFHAEATSEKIAMGWHVNGRMSIVFGTHTHVPTADATILDGGTAYISDLGMTGPYDGVLGRRKDRVLKFLTTGMPQRFEVATGDPRMYALLVKVSVETGKAESAELLVRHGQRIEGGPYDRDDGWPSQNHHKSRNKQ